MHWWWGWGHKGSWGGFFPMKFIFFGGMMFYFMSKSSFGGGFWFPWVFFLPFFVMSMAFWIFKPLAEQWKQRDGNAEKPKRKNDDIDPNFFDVKPKRREEEDEIYYIRTDDGEFIEVPRREHIV